MKWQARPLWQLPESDPCRRYSLPLKLPSFGSCVTLLLMLILIELPKCLVWRGSWKRGEGRADLYSMRRRSFPIEVTKDINMVPKQVHL